MFPALLEKLKRHENLTVDEATRAMGAIMDGEATPVLVAGLLMALALKGERPSEMAGLATAMRARAAKLPRPIAPTFDTCGTGGDGADTFSVSTATALVVAGCGVRVAKHGNRAASSRSGSADVFEALGVDLEASHDRVGSALEGAGVAFFFAQKWHPSMKHAGPVRRELGVRTAFNLLGPLTNPAGAQRQLVGVSRPEQTELLARALGDLGSERAWIVHGADGLDEISTTGYTKVSELRDGAVRTFYVHPADAGLPLSSVKDLAGGDAATNTRFVRGVIDGDPGPRRDIVLLNAAAGLLVSGKVRTLREGVAVAATSIDDGRARRALERLVAACGRT
jgi:anthranilate phosphoribosyltransferase